MPEIAAAPAPAAVSTPAPAAPAPVAAPAAAPVAAPVAATSTPSAATPGRPTSSLDPTKFENNGDYVAALLNEQMGVVPPEVEEPEEVAPAIETPAPEAPETAEDAPPAEKPATEEEPEFDFNPPAALTPEALTKMVADNPEFGKLLESDPKLKGQIYKTTREAAELKPYKEMFPDLDSAKEAVTELQSWNGIRDTFMQATTKEGAQATLAKMMELSYERDDDGNVVMQNGKAVVGDDFYGFVDHVVSMDLEHRREQVQARLDANQYHLGAKTEQERDEAIQRDVNRLAFFDEQLKDVIEPIAQDLPEPIRRMKEDLERQKAELDQKTHGTKVEQRATYERSVVTGTQERLKTSITSIIADAKKAGAVISPYLEKVLPDSIYMATIQKIVADEGLKNQQLNLQRLPATEKSKTRRLAASDRAIQHYLPDIAIEQMTAAGIQLVNSAKAKAAKIDGQIQRTNQTEPKGSTSPARTIAKGPMDTKAAMDMAETEWKKANPGRSPRDGQDAIINRVLQLTTQMSA